MLVTFISFLKELAAAHPKEVGRGVGPYNLLFLERLKLTESRLSETNHSRPKWIASGRLKSTQTDWDRLKPTETYSSRLNRFSRLESVSVGLSRFQSTWGDSLGSTVVVFSHLKLTSYTFSWFRLFTNVFSWLQKADFQSTSVVQEKASCKNGPVWTNLNCYEQNQFKNLVKFKVRPLHHFKAQRARANVYQKSIRTLRRK